MKLARKLEVIGGLVVTVNVVTILLFVIYILGEGLFNPAIIGILLLLVLETLVFFFVFKALAYIVSTMDGIKAKLDNATDKQHKQS